MLKTKQVPINAALAIAIKAAGVLDRPDLARTLLTESIKNNFGPKEELYASVSTKTRRAARSPLYRSWHRS